MADVNTLVANGMSPGQAVAIVDIKAATIDVNGMVNLGFQPHLAAYIADFGTTAPTVAGLMALGLPWAQAVDVEAIVNA